MSEKGINMCTHRVSWSVIQVLSQSQSASYEWVKLSDTLSWEDCPWVLRFENCWFLWGRSPTLSWSWIDIVPVVPEFGIKVSSFLFIKCWRRCERGTRHLWHPILCILHHAVWHLGARPGSRSLLSATLIIATCHQSRQEYSGSFTCDFESWSSWRWERNSDCRVTNWDNM